jgi:hypothetical protein
VQIGLLRRVGKVAAFSRSKQPRARPQARCIWLRSSRAKFKRVKPRHGKCSKPTFLKAKGTKSWSFKLRRRLPPGRYILYARAVDASGNKETAFSAKRHNRQAFRVIRG